MRRFRSVDRVQSTDGLTVYHPRVAVGPGQMLHAFDVTLAYRPLRKLITRLHRETPFDVLHAHFIYPEGVIASRIGAELGIPVVSSEHAMWRPWLDRHPSVRRQVERALPGIARVTTVSEALRGSITSLFGEAVPVDVIPNVVDERIFVAPRAGEARDPEHLLFVGLIRHVKGLDVLVRALGHLLLDMPGLHLSVAGGAFYRAYERDANEVRSLVQALGVANRVDFLGEVTPANVAALMRRSALLVVPSRRETFSLVTAEALASGTPVVATRCGGPEEILTDDMGQLTDPDDPAALALAIQAVLARSYDRDKLREYAVGRFGTDAASQRLARLYECVTGLVSSAIPRETEQSDRRIVQRDPVSRGLVEAAAAGGTA
jgi:glycosyltransferase involved in cell wall biosynthesis